MPHRADHLRSLSPVSLDRLALMKSGEQLAPAKEDYQMEPAVKTPFLFQG
jgi:hypothetical protein